MKAEVLLVFAFMAGAVALAAGVQPPKEMMEKTVTVIMAGDTQVTLDTFSQKAFKADAKKTWEKLDESQWLFTVTGVNKVTDKKFNMKFVFKNDPTNAQIIRYSVNGEEIPTGTLPSLVLPQFESLPKKTSSAEVDKKFKVLEGKYISKFDAGDGAMGSVSISKATKGSLMFSIEQRDQNCNIKDKTASLIFDAVTTNFSASFNEGACNLKMVFSSVNIAGEDQHEISFDQSNDECVKLFCKKPKAGMGFGTFTK